MTRDGGGVDAFFFFFFFFLQYKEANVPPSYLVRKKEKPMAARATFQQNEKRRGREGEKKVPRVIDCDCCSQLYRSQEVAPRSYHCIHSSQKSACCFYPPTPSIPPPAPLCWGHTGSSASWSAAGLNVQRQPPLYQGL